MRSVPFTVHVKLVRLPALATTMDRAGMLACIILSSVVLFACWPIAICYLVVWCRDWFVHGLPWLIKQVSRICVCMVGIIRVIIVWLGRCFVRIVIVVLWLLRQLGRVPRRSTGALIRWAIREFGEPVVCTACVYFGVLSTSVLPLALVLQLVPAVVVGLVVSPLATFVIAARVFDTRAYSRWQRGARARLGVRVLRAYSDGVTWGMWLRASNPTGRSVV